jgi:hypothetical protein
MQYPCRLPEAERQSLRDCLLGARCPDESCHQCFTISSRQTVSSRSLRSRVRWGPRTLCAIRARVLT